MSNSEYQYQCGGCVYYDFQGDYKKGYCSWYRSYYYPGDNCSHQKPVNATSGCYITTIVCDVLGLDDDCSLLNNLRSFRDNVLQKDAKFTPLLMEYDSIGPEIALLIKKDYEESKDDTLWKKYYDTYLVGTEQLVKENNYDGAINKYVEMVQVLKTYFGLDKVTSRNIAQYDFSNGGHGKIMTKKNGNI